jgi:DHA2 family multidrug resistance protein
MGLAGLQLMLDRGQQKDWFGSTEIIAEAVIAGLGFYLFTVHLFTAEKPFITPRIFKDINFVSGLLVMFGVGMVLLSSLALLAPYLQDLGGYEVAQAGLLMVPRGVGTMIAMLIAGRLLRHIDARLLMFAGLLAIAASMWQMTGWTPDISVWSLSTTSIIQGFGLGFVFIPLQVVAFSTLPVELRTQGTALYSLMRNVGSAIGISTTAFLLAQNTQIMHANLAAHVTPFNRMLQSGGAFLYWNSVSPAGVAALNAEINRQALIIAYVDDFKFMLLITLPTALLLLLMRRPSSAPAPAGVID